MTPRARPLVALLAAAVLSQCAPAQAESVVKLPAAAVDPAFDRLAQAWDAHGARHRLQLARFAGGHHFGIDRQTAAFDWLHETLSEDLPAPPGSG